MLTKAACFITLRPPSYNLRVIKTWHLQPELNLKRTNLHQLQVRLAVQEVLGVVIFGRAYVCSVITERVTQANYEPFINIHSCTWRAGTLACVCGGVNGGGERGGGGQVLT